jgi:hypothetical protein
MNTLEKRLEKLEAATPDDDLVTRLLAVVGMTQKEAEAKYADRCTGWEYQFLQAVTAVLSDTIQKQIDCPTGEALRNAGMTGLGGESQSETK